MVWPFGSPDPGKPPRDEESRREAASTRRPFSWPESLMTEDPDPLAVAKHWAPVVVISAVGLATLQLYANYLRRIPGAAFVRPSFFHKRSLYGRVTSVGDGDNFHMFHTPGGRLMGWNWLRKIPEVRKELRNRTIPVRIAGIDAPEGAHFGKPAQPFSGEALRWLSDYVLNRNIRAYVYKRDQYDRIVATVYVRRFLVRRNVGLEMVKCGLATTYEAKTGGEYGGMKEVYQKAEVAAKKKRKGMWSGKASDFESPREYKTKWANIEKKQAAEEEAAGAASGWLSFKSLKRWFGGS